MSNIRIVGSALPNIPWEHRPAGTSAPVWRYSRNPIIPRDAIPTSNSIFNSAAVPFEGKFAGVFRCDNQRREMILHAGFSDDGFKWNIDHEPIKWILPDDVPAPEYAYDARVCWVEDRFWVTWCNGFHGPTIGIGYTKDFKSFNLLENALRHTQKGGQVTIRAERSDENVRFAVQDTGEGIDKSELEKIFNSFYQSSSSGGAGGGRLGLGLSISKEIVHSHGGSIWVESGGKGKGSTFYFTIPGATDGDKPVKK